MSHWQPIETAPRDGTIILLYAKPTVVAGRWSDAGTGKYPWDFLDGETSDPEAWPLNAMHDNEYGPTHWMPLPEPPLPEVTTTR